MGTCADGDIGGLEAAPVEVSVQEVHVVLALVQRPLSLLCAERSYRCVCRVTHLRRVLLQLRVPMRAWTALRLSKKARVLLGAAEAHLKTASSWYSFFLLLSTKNFSRK